MGKKVEEEEAFPRGRQTADQADADGEENRSQRAQPKGDKTRRKRSRGSGKKPGDASEEEVVDGETTTPTDQISKSVIRLRPRNLAEGTLLVAAVREASDEELTLNLPFNLQGYVSRAQATEPGELLESLPPLPQAYPVGRLVVAVVTAVVEVGKDGKHRIELSLRPSLANAGLTSEDIAPHMWLPVLVRSEEEHVFKVDFCVSGLQGLLKKSEAQSLVGSGAVVKPGIVLQVGIKAAPASTGVIRCTASASEGTLGAEPIKLPALKAGFLVHARVDKLLPAPEVGSSKEVTCGSNAGVIANFCGSLSGVMHWHHQGLGKDGGGLKYKQRVTARVLAVVPGPQIQVHLTMLPHLLDWELKPEALTSLPVGERLEGFPLDLQPKYGCRLRCVREGASGQVFAFCPIGRMSEAPAEDSEVPAATKLVAGQKTECRVLSYNFLDSTVIVTRRPTDLKHDTLVSPLELSAGQMVSGEISRLCEYGVFVKLSDFVTALVHLRQLTDVPLAAVPPKYQVGTKLKCRVLKIHTEKRQVSLTAKKSLVRSAFQFSSFEQARKDMIVTGYVSSVKEHGAIVTFFGDIFGLIPAREMSKDEAPALGMAVKCRISEINKRRRRIALSLDLEKGKEPGEFEGTEDLDEAPAQPGDLAKDAVAVESLEEGIVVKCSTDRPGGSALRAFVPLPHLSDDLEQAKARHAFLTKALKEEASASLQLGNSVILARRFKQGPKEGNGFVDEEGEGMVLVSMKPTLLLAAKEGAFVKDFSQLQTAKLYNGYVKQILDGGVLVSFGGWRIAGFAPKHQLANHYVEKPSEEFHVGQTVRALLQKLDTEKQRYTVNLSKPFATSADSQLLQREAEALRLYFATQAELAPPGKSSSSLIPGSVLEATVTSTQPYGVLLSLDAHKGLTGLALKENIPTGTKTDDGKKLRCCVLDFDTTSGIADVSLQSELLAGDGAFGAGFEEIRPELSTKKRKKNAGGTGAEVQVSLALQKPAYSVLWCREPPAVLFAPPWERQPRWSELRPSVVHTVPEQKGFFSRLLARSPHGGGGGERKKRKVAKILRPDEELKVGSPVTMRVVSVKGLEVFCAAPVGIRGHVHATHFLDGGELGSGGENPVAKIQKSDLLEARVLQMQHREKMWHLELTCRPSLLKPQDATAYEDARASWKTLKPGKKVSVAVESVRKNLIWVEVAPGVKGQISALDASTDVAVVRALDKHFLPGQVFESQVLRSQKKELDLILHGAALGPAPVGKTLARLEKMEDLSHGGIAASFRLPGKRRGFVHVTELYDFWAEFPMKRMHPGSIYEAYVVESADEGERAEISLRSSFVHGQAEGPEEARPLLAGSLKLGQKVTGYVVNSGEKGVFVAISRKLVGRIKLKALSDQVVLKQNVSTLHRPGDLIRQATVVEINEEQNRVELSLRKTNTGGRLTVQQLSVGDVLSGRVKAVEKYGLFVRIDNSSVDGLVHRNEISDSASVSLESYQVGSIIPRAKVLKIENGKLWLGLKTSLFDPSELEDDEDGDNDELEAELATAGTAVDQPEDEDDHELNEEVAEPAPKKQKKAAKTVDADDDDDDDERAPWEKAAKTAAVLAEDSLDRSMGGFDFADFKVAEEDDSEADGFDGEDEEGEQGQKRPSKRQKKALKLAEAKEIQQHEAENAEGRWANDPRSVEDFERLLLTQGDTSIVWIRYMAFHLKMSDLERARQVAERAVKHVGFAEGKERFNVWVAFMNLECTFGTEQTADAVFRRASSHNDSKQVHLQLARIHERNHKLPMAAKVYEACSKKFPQSKKVWLAQLACSYRQGELDVGRKALPKCLAVLPKRKHPIVVSKAALLEYQYGSVERGRSVFEGLLDSYPKRTDLWSVYIDAHIKAHTPPKVAKPDFAEVRALLERCCAMKLKATKMRFFFKRWLDFEKRYGDIESQELVRNKARQFVENQAS